MNTGKFLYVKAGDWTRLGVQRGSLRNGGFEH